MKNQHAKSKMAAIPLVRPIRNVSISKIKSNIKVLNCAKSLACMTKCRTNHISTPLLLYIPLLLIFLQSLCSSSSPIVLNLEVLSTVVCLLAHLLLRLTSIFYCAMFKVLAPKTALSPLVDPKSFFILTHLSTAADSRCVHIS